MDQAAAQLAQDNCELACCFIQKTAVEKAGPEMDKRLATEFELRKHARQEGRRYCDPVVLTYQAERMPEQIRLKVRIRGSVSPCPNFVFLLFLLVKLLTRNRTVELNFVSEKASHLSSISLKGYLCRRHRNGLDVGLPLSSPSSHPSC